MTRAGGPFKALEKVSNNAYKMDLLGEYAISYTFNMANLKPYYGPVLFSGKFGVWDG